MNLENNNLIISVVVVDAKNWSENEIDSKIKSISKQKKHGELYLVTTLQIESSIETYPEGQVLNIAIEDTSGIANDDIESLLKALGELRDYYPDLTVKVIDKTNKMSTKGLPEDVIIKKNQE